jgi:hypothetical protein
MPDIMTKPVELPNESVGKFQGRIATFSISRTGPNSTISIIGYFRLKPALSSIRFSKGTIHVGSNSYIVFDRQAMAGLPAKDITEETCIVLLYENEKLSHKATAYIVDDTTELLSLLNGQN